KCGKLFVVRANNLLNRPKTSCGCRPNKGNLRHGGFGTPEWNVWQTMKQRCANQKSRHFQNYGGRGIRVCRRWLESFANFIGDMGKRPSAKHTLERKEVNGHYQPSNCCWATKLAQANNTR